MIQPRSKCMRCDIYYMYIRPQFRIPPESCVMAIINDLMIIILIWIKWGWSAEFRPQALLLFDHQHAQSWNIQQNYINYDLLQSKLYDKWPLIHFKILIGCRIWLRYKIINADETHHRIKFKWPQFLYYMISVPAEHSRNLERICLIMCIDINW